MVYIVSTWSLFADPVTYVYVYTLQYKNLVVENIIRVQSSPGFSEAG